MVGLAKETQQRDKGYLCLPHGKTPKNQKSKKTEVKTKKQKGKGQDFFIFW
jgi:hypothetical protein